MLILGIVALGAALGGGASSFSDTVRRSRTNQTPANSFRADRLVEPGFGEGRVISAFAAIEQSE